MPYVERTDEEIGRAFRQRLEKNYNPDQAGIIVGNTSYTLRQLSEQIELGTDVGRQICDIARTLGKNMNEDPIEQIMTVNIA